MLLIAVRVLILYGVLVVAVRVMGKRQMGQLQPFELVIAILLAELASTPMSNKEVPLINGIISIFILVVVHVWLSFLSLKSQVIRPVVCGRPAVLIDAGVVQERQLRLLRYNMNDLLEQLRVQGHADISDVEYALLETNGQLSVIPKAYARPLQPEDIDLTPTQDLLPVTLIIDGVIDDGALNRLRRDRAWLYTELSKHYIRSAQDVLFACLDKRGKLFYQLKETVTRRQESCAQ
ncbi:MAG TPA: DUF421 domain-containing protein [Firmicutes bacterium]|nr:DUF421 domain-containing protein [Bacillota bacterium]